MKRKLPLFLTAILVFGNGCITPNYKYAWVQPGKSEPEIKQDFGECLKQLQNQPFAPKPLALVEDPVAKDLSVRFIRSCMESKGYKSIDAAK